MSRTRNQGSKWIRKDKRLAIYLRDNLACVYCDADTEDAALTIDHLNPCENGGTNHESNLVTCCLSCNSAKRDLSIRVWYATLRNRGVDTDRVSRRVRRLTKKDLAPFRTEAKRIIQDRRKDDQ